MSLKVTFERLKACTVLNLLSFACSFDLRFELSFYCSRCHACLLPCFPAMVVVDSALCVSNPKITISSVKLNKKVNNAKSIISNHNNGRKYLSIMYGITNFQNDFYLCKRPFILGRNWN